MTRFTSLLCLLLALGVTASGYATAADLKIGVVNMDELIQASPRTARGEALLKSQSEEYDKERSVMMAQLQKLKEEFESVGKEAMSSALSETARKEREAEAREKLADLRDYEIKVRDTIQRRSDELADQKLRIRREAVDSIRGIIATYARKNGYTLVLDSAGKAVSAVEPVVYSDEGLDITKAILEVVKTDADDESEEEDGAKKKE